MQIAYEVESLDDEPELVREHYIAKTNGGFRLQLTNHPSHEELREQLRTEKTAIGRATQQIHALEMAAVQDQLAEAKRHAEPKPVVTVPARHPDDVRLEKECADKLAAHEAGIKANIESLRADRNSVALERVATEIASKLAVSGSHALLMPFVRERLTASDTNGHFEITAKDAASIEHLTEQLRADARFSRVLNGHSSAADKARHQALVDATLGLTAGPASVTRAQFQALSATERAAFARTGGKLSDA
jgi:hypothetical protein